MALINSFQAVTLIMKASMVNEMIEQLHFSAGI